MDFHRFKSIGRIYYDPKRPGLKNKTRGAKARSSVDWWCIVRVDDEIARYYRWWINRRWWGRTAMQENWLSMPSWGTHISVVRGEEPEDDRKHLWRKYHGVDLEFEYEHRIRQTNDFDRTRRYTKDGDFFFVDAWCPRLDEIRAELGFPTYHKFHITVARTYDIKIGRI